MPSTLPPAVCARVKVALLNVEFVIASENVAVIEAFSATPSALFDGDKAVTIGGVVSGATAVVKLQLYR